MSYISNITPEKVIPAIRDHLIGDGFEFVLDLEKSHGSYMIDVLTGREYLDFYTCFASNPLGFNHPKMTDENTVEKLKITAINNVTNSDLFTNFKAEFVKTFHNKAAPNYMPYMFLIAGGALAVENAMKAAFDWKAQMNRSHGDTLPHDLKIMHFKEAFHGRSGYTMSVTNTDPVKTDLYPKFNWPRIDNAKIVFPDKGANHEDLLRREKRAIEQAKHTFLIYGNSIAALLIEPIQSEGGDNHFRHEFLQELQMLCNENDCMFIVDEIQTGMGITGKMWAHEHHELKPDMLCFGKKTQVCGFVCSEKIDTVEKNVFKVSSRINSTWGGNLVDMVRCQRYLDIIEEDNLIDNAAKMGDLLLSELQGLQKQNPGLISNARGSGLMCAFDLPTPAKRDALRLTLFEEGMLILPCGECTLRFRPALMIGKADIYKAIRFIEDALPKIA